jgi:hypothetical protein
MGSLSSSFESYNELQNDPTLCSISILLNSFQDVLSGHYSHVRDHIVAALALFLKNNITRAEEDARKAAHDLDAYLKSVDGYAASVTKRSRSTNDDRETKLKAAHLQAVCSSFRLDRTLSLVERRQVLEVTANCLMFMNLASVSFKQCHFLAESAADGFTQIQSSLPESVKSVKLFENQVESLDRTLRATHDFFWRRGHIEFPGTQSFEHEGWLWRRGGGFSRWHRFFFQIQNHELSCFDAAAQDFREAVPLMLTAVKPVNDSERCFTFSLITRNKTIIFQALTEWDMLEWIGVIQNNIQYCLDHAGDEVVESSAPDPTDPRSANPKCADCGEGDPSWCCLNWGICVCIKCCGVHREMTTAVSKVRSLTLDRLDAKFLDVFAVAGNDFMNGILEEGLERRDKLVRNADRAERDAFLRRKYAECEFVSLETAVDVAAAIAADSPHDVLRGICQMRRLKHENHELLWLAAAYGNPTICVIVGLNSSSIDGLDDQGWTALSYAAFYGREAAAEALMAIGCDVQASPMAHPYEVTTSPGLKALFLPYWKGPEKPGVVFEPLIRIKRNPMKRKMSIAKFSTMDLLSQAAIDEALAGR